MKNIVLVFVFAIPLLFAMPSTGQSKEALKSIMANSWVKKYKKLKTDLEDKAYFIKNMENISESDLKSMEKNYQITTKMLDTWLLDFANSVELKKENISYLSEGTINPELKQELLDIFTYYTDNFTTQYEDITGQKSKMIISHQQLMEEGEIISSNSTNFEKVDRPFLMANLVEPLKSTAWNKIY